MEKVTLRVPVAQVGGVDELVDEGVYANRSAAVRDAIRTLLRAYDREPWTPYSPPARGDFKPTSRRLRPNGGSR